MSTGACVQNQIHIGSLRMPTSGIIWLGRIILFFIMLLLAGLSFFNFKQTNSLFYFSAYFGGKCGPYCTKENLEGKVNLTGSFRCLCCSLLAWLDALIFLTGNGLYRYTFSTGYTAFILCNSTCVQWFLPSKL